MFRELVLPQKGAVMDQLSTGRLGAYKYLKPINIYNIIVRGCQLSDRGNTKFGFFP
jgi:hypothetical protein